MSYSRLGRQHNTLRDLILYKTIRIREGNPFPYFQLNMVNLNLNDMAFNNNLIIHIEDYDKNSEWVIQKSITHFFENNILR